MPASKVYILFGLPSDWEGEDVDFQIKSPNHKTFMKAYKSFMASSATKDYKGAVDIVLLNVIVDAIVTYDGYSKRALDNFEIIMNHIEQRPLLPKKPKRAKAKAKNVTKADRKSVV